MDSMAVADLLRRDEADALVREAHLNTHRYPRAFPGFRARLRVSDEHGMVVGRMVVSSDGVPAVRLTGGDASTAGWAHDGVTDMLRDRWHRRHDDADGRYDADAPDPVEGPLGRVVHVSDPELTTYWIENGHIARVSRTTPEGRVTTQIQEHVVAPDGGRVPSHFVVVVHDERTSEIISTRVHRDAWIEHGGLLLPHRRRVVTLTPRGSSARELVLEHHEPLAAPTRSDGARLRFAPAGVA